jgi:type IV pilus assembly protein PilV
MIKRLFKNQQGFSLIEAMIAMVILSVGLMAVGLMQIGAMKGNTNALSRGDGVAMAQSVMDTLRSLPMDDDLLKDDEPTPIVDLDLGVDTNYADLDPDAATHSGSELFGSDEITGVNNQTYTIFWNVDDDSPIAETKTVRVFVYWNDQKFGLNRAIMTSVVGGLYL